MHLVKRSHLRRHCRTFWIVEGLKLFVCNSLIKGLAFKGPGGTPDPPN
ncbi:hypothetical protein Hanom_Chr08g00722321 [Helianthus anomalus]